MTKAYLPYTLFFLFLTSVIVSGCKKDPAQTEPLPDQKPTLSGTFTAKGKVQKGPFIDGTPIKAYELNESLASTGRSFTTFTVDGEGYFSIPNMDLRSPYLLITATGFYYNEHFNITSGNTLYLEALIDTLHGQTANVNILTHLIKPRIATLVASGISFTSSVTQAQNEILAILNITNNPTLFQQRDLINDPVLLSTSLLFQRSSNIYQNNYDYTSELNSLMNHFRNDLGDNGQIDSGWIIDTLLHNANHVNLIDVKENIERYIGRETNTLTTAPAFEQFIYKFQQKYSSTIVSSVEYPSIATFQPDPAYAPAMLYNILYPVRRVYSPGTYALAAKVPFNEDLHIIITNHTGTGSYSLSYPQYGWKTDTVGSIELTAQRRNVELGCRIQLNGVGGQDSAMIFIFTNNMNWPSSVSSIVW